jgi:hypothetical protein
MSARYHSRSEENALSELHVAALQNDRDRLAAELQQQTASLAQRSLRGGHAISQSAMADDLARVPASAPVHGVGADGQLVDALGEPSRRLFDHVDGSAGAEEGRVRIGCHRHDYTDSASC